MKREYNVQKESFSAFSASLNVGDTAVFRVMSGAEQFVQMEGLLQRGVAVRTPNNPQLNEALQTDGHTVQELLGWVIALDRWTTEHLAERLVAPSKKKNSKVLEAKAHRLVVEGGLGVVAACRKVHCRPSDYYIYRSKLK